MNNDEYMQKMIDELAADGIVAPNSSVQCENKNQNDKELEIILNMEKVTGTQFSDEQRKILEHHGNACILACAGSGKTLTSVNLIAKRILSGEIADVNKLIYATYSKAGATEMQDRLNKLLNTLGVHVKVEVRTLHSFFLKILRTFGNNANIIEESTRRKFIKESCKEAEFTTKDDELALIDNLLSYQVNNLLSDKKTIESSVNTIESLTVEQYAKIRKGYADKKAAKGLIDYDDMQTYLYVWMVKYMKSSNQAERDMAVGVLQYCKAMWTDFYIDEAQDVSKIQFAILRAMVTELDNKNKLDKGLVFIGDDDQCIYEWRGSDPSIILSIGATFDMKVFVLSTNYRCYSEVVNYAAHGIRCNNSRYTKGMKAFNEGGNVKILQSNKTDLCSLSILAMKQIKKWIDNGDNPSDIAVLCRNNFHLAILSNMLLREGIYCNYTNDMKLTKSYMYSDIKNIINICDTTWKPELTRSIMWKLCRYMSLANAAFIAEVQDTSALSLEDTLGWLTKNFIDKNIEFNKPIKVSVQLDEKAKYTMSKMSSETLNDIKLVYNTLKLEDKVEKLETLMYKYMESAAYLYKSRDKSRSIQGLVIYIKNLIKKDGYDNMLEFLRVTEQLEDGRMVIPGEKLTLTTIHSAKGREWKNVIMFACDNVSMPNYDTIKKMSEDELPVSDIYNYIDEERRLYYVGNTRAKSNLVSITYNEPSIFMMECIGIFDNKLGSNNSTVLSLALDPTEMVKYKDDVDKKLKDTNSKYYYTLD